MRAAKIAGGKAPVEFVSISRSFAGETTGHRKKLKPGRDVKIYQYVGDLFSALLRRNKVDGFFRDIVITRIKPLLIMKLEHGLGQSITPQDALTLHNGLHKEMTPVLHKYARTLRWLIECEKQDFQFGASEQLVLNLLSCAAAETTSDTGKRAGSTTRDVTLQIDKLIEKHAQKLKKAKVPRSHWAKRISTKLRGKKSRTAGTVNRILAGLGYPAR